MNKKWLLVVCGVVTAVFIFSACNKKEADGPDSGNFDKQAMLANYADNIIIPAYDSFALQFAVMETDANSFLATPSATTQDALRISFKNTYLRFEHVTACQFGPAEDPFIMFTNFVNTFPTNSTAIESNITAGTYDLQGNLSAEQQGLPALDYLFFSPNAVTKFADANSANRKKYVQDVMGRIKSLTTSLVNKWKSGYRDQFITNTKADVGSPIGYMVNQFAFEMDALKGPRIGYPFGKQSGGVVFADKCEAYYGGFSAALAVENLTSLKNMYMGGTGSGIDDYLVALKKEQLNADVLNQFDVTLGKLKAIPDPMSAAFTNNATLVNDAYKEVQLLLTLIKTDVASATAVRITYQDSDGD